MYLTNNYRPVLSALQSHFLRPTAWLEGASEQRSLLPAVDIKEDEKQWNFLVNLPGIKNEDIDISIDGNVLSVDAKTVEENEEERGKYTHVERYEGVYRRSFRLPESVDPESVKAKSVDGVLNITLDKKEVAQPKKIQVEAA